MGTKRTRDSVERDLIEIFGELDDEPASRRARLLPPSTSNLQAGPSTSYHTEEMNLIDQMANDDDAEIHSDEEYHDADENIESSDSESESDDDEAEMQSSQMQEDWTLHNPSRNTILFQEDELFHIPAETRTPYDYFRLLFTNELICDIVNATNECAKEVLAYSTGEHSRISRWKDLNVAEFLTFLGVLFHMGNIKLNRYSDYWRQHYLYKLPFKNFISKNRFLLIFRCLRFGQNNLQDLINYFNSKMPTLYTPGKNLTIDESMILSRGRSGIRQYLKGKRHKYGIKLYILATPSGLSLKTHMYQGKRDTEVGGQGHVDKVVIKLIGKYLNTGRSLFMDNFYNSVKLSEFLLRNKINVTGTLRVNRKENPSIVCTARLRKGGSIYRYNKNEVSVCMWRDTRDVLTISTEYTPELKPVVTKTGATKLEPEVVIQYNKYMKGVDRQDQMLSYYTCERKTMRWYKKVGIHIFQMMMLNTYYLYKGNTTNDIDFYKFRESVLENLLPAPRSAPPIQNIHLPEHCPKDRNGNTLRRRCKHCWDTTKTRKRSLYFCTSCPSQPGLCLECFRPFHNY